MNKKGFGRTNLLISAVILLFLFSIPFYLNPYYVYFVQIVGVYSIVTIGLNLLAGYSGLFMAGQAGIFAASAYTFTLLVTQTQSPFLLAALAGILASGVIGLLLGIPSLRLSGFYLAMVTLGFAIAIFDMLLEWANITGGWSGIFGIPSPKIGPWILSGRSIYYMVIILTVVILWFMKNIRDSKWGRAFFLVRDSEIAAASIGISGYRTKLLSFFLCSVFAGIGGVLYPLTARGISPFVFDLKVAVFFLLCIIIGGMGMMMGPVIGVALLLILPEVLEGYQAITNITYAVIVIAILALAPEGLSGAFRNMREKWSRSRVKPEAKLGSASLSENPHLEGIGFGNPEGHNGNILEINDLTKRFGGLVAVHQVNVEVKAGTLHSIIGPNGSGKTTFFNLISGFYPSDSGNILFRNQKIHHMNPHEIARLGIGRTFQTPKVARDLTVLENVMLGFHMHSNATVLESMFKMPRSRHEEKSALDRTLNIVRFMGLSDLANVKAKNLPHGHLRMLEIARVIACEPKLILLDEPAAGLSHQEIDHLERILRNLVDLGCTILLVEHNIGLVMRVAQEITVFDYGEKIAEGPPEAIQQSPEVMDAYLGSTIAT